jgi:hypothetical protein
MAFNTNYSKLKLRSKLWCLLIGIEKYIVHLTKTSKMADVKLTVLALAPAANATPAPKSASVAPNLALVSSAPNFAPPVQKPASSIPAPLSGTLNKPAAKSATPSASCAGIVAKPATFTLAPKFSESIPAAAKSAPPTYSSMSWSDTSQ